MLPIRAVACSLLLALSGFMAARAQETPDPEERFVSGRDVVDALRRHAGEEIWFGMYMGRLSAGTLRFLVVAEGGFLELQIEWRVRKPMTMTLESAIEYGREGNLLAWREYVNSPDREASTELLGDSRDRLRGTRRSRVAGKETTGAFGFDAPPGTLPIRGLLLVAPALVKEGLRVHKVSNLARGIQTARFDAPARETLEFRGSSVEVDRIRLREPDETGEYTWVPTCAALDGKTLQFKDDEGMFSGFLRGTQAEVATNLPFAPGQEEILAAAGEFLAAVLDGDSARALDLLDPAGGEDASRTDRVRALIEKIDPRSQDTQTAASFSALDLAATMVDARIEGDRAWADAMQEGTIELVRRDGVWRVLDWRPREK